MNADPDDAADQALRGLRTSRRKRSLDPTPKRIVAEPEPRWWAAVMFVSVVAGLAMGGLTCWLMIEGILWLRRH